jgi:hypothetical protein
LRQRRFLGQASGWVPMSMGRSDYCLLGDLGCIPEFVAAVSAVAQGEEVNAGILRFAQE